MRLPRPILIAVSLAFVLALALLFDVSPYLRGGFGWRWNYDPAPILRAVPLIITTIIYIAVAYLLLNRTSRTLPILLWAMFGTAILPLCVIWLRSDDVLFELFARTASGLTTGPHLAATQVNWAGAEWRNWSEVMARIGGHISTSPPGLLMGYAALNDALEHLPGVAQPLYRVLLPYQCQNYTLLNETPAQWASAWFGILMPLWAAFSVLPLFGVVRRLYDESTARGIVFWWALVPGVSAFAGTWNTLYPMMSLVVFALLTYGLDNDSQAQKAYRTQSLIGAGMVTGIALFMHFTFLPLVAFCGCYVLGVCFVAANRDSLQTTLLSTLRRAIWIGVLFGIGLALPWLIFWLAGGQTFFTLLRASLDAHLSLDRPYVPWLFLSPWDWALFTGVGWIVLWLISLRRPTPLNVSLGLVLLILTVSGGTQGESGRIWLLLSPFVLMSAASGIRQLIGDLRKRAWLALTIAHAVVMIVIVGCLDVIGHDFTLPPVAPVSAAALQQASAQFTASNSDSFRLDGWDAAVSGTTLTLNLRWQGVTQSTAVYFFGVLLVAPDGTVYETGVWQPGRGTPVPANSNEDSRGTFPTTCWLAGTVVGDSVTLTLPVDAESGDWWISLAAYGDDTVSDGRLLVTLPDGTQDSQIGLGPVHVP
jgi:hypothetical protein